MIGQRVALTDSRCLIVMYHYVRPLPDPELPYSRGMPLPRFEEQIRLLTQEWEFVSLDDYLDGLEGSRKLPQNCCILSFDDGLSDHYDYVFPLLSRLGIPGVFFTCSSPATESRMLDVHMTQYLVARLQPEELARRIGATVRIVAPEDANSLLNPDSEQVNRIYHYEPEWATRWTKYVMNFVLPESLRREVTLLLFEEEFGSEQEFGRKLYLTPEQIRVMSENGMTVGSHGHKHIAMSNCDPQQKREELRRSRDVIESWSGQPVSSFCYPWGGSSHIDSESEDALVELGYRCGLTTLDGLNEGEVSPFYLQRRDCIQVPGGY